MPERTIAEGNAQDTMKRAMHTDTNSAQGVCARGIRSCARRGLAGFPNSLPKAFGTDATT
jgi:hypothetical protein